MAVIEKFRERTGDGQQEHQAGTRSARSHLVRTLPRTEEDEYIYSDK